MGWVRSNLDAVRRLKAQVQGGFTLIGQDGTRHRVTEADFYENFMRNAERLRAAYKGEEVPPPHSTGEALKGAVNSLPQVLQNAADNQRRLDKQLEDKQQ